MHSHLINVQENSLDVLHIDRHFANVIGFLLNTCSGVHVS